MPPRKANLRSGLLFTKKMSTDQSTRRQPVRGQTGNKVSTKKSPYFDDPSGEEDEESGDEGESEEGSEFGGGDNVFSEHESAASLSEKGSNTSKLELEGSKKRKENPINTPLLGAKKLKRPGEIFIPIRQPSPGGIEYQAHRIHPNTLNFLKGLFHPSPRQVFCLCAWIVRGGLATLINGIPFQGDPDFITADLEIIALAKNNDRTWFGGMALYSFHSLHRRVVFIILSCYVVFISGPQLVPFHSSLHPHLCLLT